MNKKFKQHIIFNIFLEKRVIYTKWIKTRRTVQIRIQKMKMLKMVV